MQPFNKEMGLPTHPLAKDEVYKHPLVTYKAP